jgi:hypothetical protein
MRRSSAIPSSILTLAEIVIPGKVDGNPPMPEDTWHQYRCRHRPPLQDLLVQIPPWTVSWSWSGANPLRVLDRVSRKEMDTRSQLKKRWEMGLPVFYSRSTDPIWRSPFLAEDQASFALLRSLGRRSSPAGQRCHRQSTIPPGLRTG